MANVPINASLTDVIEAVKNNIYSNLNCHNIGRIIDYNKEMNTCTVEILQVKQWYEQKFYPTIIPNVPLVTFGTFNCRIMPSNPVDNYCILLFLDRNIDNFMETGEAQVPATERMHSISDCVALLTINPDTSETNLYDENALTLSNKDTINDIEYQSYIKIKPNKININADKIIIENSIRNLSTLIQGLLTACENIATVADESGGVLTPETKQAFTDLKTQFGELLE